MSEELSVPEAWCVECGQKFWSPAYRGRRTAGDTCDRCLRREWSSENASLGYRIVWDETAHSYRLVFPAEKP